MNYVGLNCMDPLICGLFSIVNSTGLLQEGGPLPGPESGSCLTLGNELSEETHLMTKQETLLGRGAWEESRRVREPRRTALLRGSQSRFLWWWDSFQGCLWPIILTQGPFWWREHRSAKMDSSEKDSGRLVGHVDWRLLSPFDLSWILPFGGGLLVLCSLPGSPVIK